MTIPAAKKNCISPWTHFIMEGPRQAHGFSIDTCEQCGKQVEDANSIQIHETRAKLLSLGCTEVQEADRLDEQGYCDALEGCACPDCFVEEKPSVNGLIEEQHRIAEELGEG